MNNTITLNDRAQKRTQTITPKLEIQSIALSERVMSIVGWISGENPTAQKYMLIYDLKTGNQIKKIQISHTKYDYDSAPSPPMLHVIITPHNPEIALIPLPDGSISIWNSTSNTSGRLLIKKCTNITYATLSSTGKLLIIYADINKNTNRMEHHCRLIDIR